MVRRLPSLLIPATAAAALVATTAAMPGDVANGPYHHRCAEARTAGAAPLLVGQPGYREGLDANGDEIACEPFR